MNAFYTQQTRDVNRDYPDNTAVDFAIYFWFTTADETTTEDLLRKTSCRTDDLDVTIRALSLNV